MLCIGRNGGATTLWLEVKLDPNSQGSSFVATLGFGAESRWDSLEMKFEKAEANRKRESNYNRGVMWKA
jgi:hypothetical protein